MAVEITIGGVGLLGLLTLFETCNRAYDVFIRSAKNLGKDAHRLGVHLAVERQKLRLWGQYLGLSKTQQCRLLRAESLETQRIVVMQLDAIKNTLDDIDIIMVRYGVRIVQTNEEMTDHDPSAALGGLDLEDIRSCEVVRMAGIKRVTTERSIQASTSRLGKLRWALNDNRKLEKLVVDLRKINEDLWVALPVNKWLALARGLPSVVLPEIQNQQMLLEVGGDARDNERTQVLAACVELRNAAITSEAQASNLALTDHFKLDPSCVKEFIPLSTGDLDSTVETQRQLALVKIGEGPQKLVVIEWRYVDRELKPAEQSELRSRIRSLAGLLSSRRSSEFGLLKCIGYYKDIHPITERYALVFEVQNSKQLPPAPFTPKPYLQTSRPRSLHELISTSKTNKASMKMPLLEDRFRIATELCNIVLQLHASSWLHKAIRSSNILFFPKVSTASSSEANALDISHPYLMGYDYSRQDKINAESLDIPTNRTFNDYRHPALWSPPDPEREQRYRKEFDIYSLGVVLLEVGNWRLVAGQSNQHRDPDNPLKWKEHLLECTDALGYRCGSTYREVVRTCLTGRFSEEVVWSDVSFLFDVVYKLENCSA